MINFDSAEKITEGAYIFRNSLSDDLCTRLAKQSEESPEDAHYLREEDNIYLIGTPVLQECIDHVDEILKDSGYWSDLYLHWMLPAGYKFFVHRDDANPDYSGFDKEWGAVIYLTDFEGGELYYPDQDITCKPNRRDIVIHRSDLPHGTNVNLTEGRRTITCVIYGDKKETA
jgi:hypothetical protein